MGLTIYYSFRSDAKTIEEARHQVEQLRQTTIAQSFEEVNELIEIESDDCDHERHKDGKKLLLIHASRVILEEKLYKFQPQHLFVFTSMPGAGCETAIFGLAKTPEFIESKKEERLVMNGQWVFSSYCKTQYASSPKYGGIENFVRSHLAMIAVLDKANELGIIERVNDGGEYWQKRDLNLLIRNVGEMNEIVAGVAGSLKDLGGEGAWSSLMFGFQDFEHLEAKGRKEEEEDDPK